jgi:hypothetical protein
MRAVTRAADRARDVFKIGKNFWPEGSSSGIAVAALTRLAPETQGAVNRLQLIRQRETISIKNNGI